MLYLPKGGHSSERGANVNEEAEEWLSVEDVARQLRVTIGAVREWITAGKLKATKPGREYRIKRAWLEAMLAEYETAR